MSLEPNAQTDYVITKKSESSSKGGIVPSGSLEITENGIYDVTKFESLLANIPTIEMESGTITFKDSNYDILFSNQHDTAPTFYVVSINTTEPYSTFQNERNSKDFVVFGVDYTKILGTSDVPASNTIWRQCRKETGCAHTYGSGTNWNSGMTAYTENTSEWDKYITNTGLLFTGHIAFFTRYEYKWAAYWINIDDKNITT